jgi:hypothetical protein
MKRFVIEQHFPGHPAPVWPAPGSVDNILG